MAFYEFSGPKGVEEPLGKVADRIFFQVKTHRFLFNNFFYYKLFLFNRLSYPG
jgi:hypothetical protein